jgi:hypothetical protein
MPFPPLPEFPGQRPADRDRVGRESPQHPHDLLSIRLERSFRHDHAGPLQNTMPAYAGSGDSGSFGVNARKGWLAGYALLARYSYRPDPASW